MADAVSYTNAFTKNCPNARLQKDEVDELCRLFKVCADDARRRAKTLDGYEADVIEAAQDLVDAWEGSKYGPAQNLVKQAEKYLIDRVADLAAENDGVWRRPANL